ncbi:thioredoxin [Bacillus phage Mater]|uniref:Thioredoxin n=1 Tax=Bacillus phage Mater TaxID=1540090 RepID=A0A0A0RNR7_9CAUD|nr:thioredoxin [Bacillus phage Mater]AIW03284.1 thioredoxin [Bacillus phage Mater]
MANKLIKLEKHHCRFCGELERYLQGEGVEYITYNMDDKPAIAAKYGVMSAPVLILADEEDNAIKQVNGYFRDQIEELLEEYRKEA